MTTNRFIITVFCVAALLSTGGVSHGGDTLPVGEFSKAKPGSGLPGAWEPLTFDDIERHTDYRLVQQNNTTVVRAESDNAASGLIRKIRVDPEKYPVIKWRWKATGVYEKGDVTKKSGDDYPARIYIAFEYDPEKVGFFEKAKFEAAKMLHGEYPPTGAINYIWSSTAKKHTMVPNPFTDRVTMVVVQSGRNGLNRWVEEERNIYEDYRKIFGEKPPMISGIAVMTDSDNTGESAVTYYGDISMHTGK